MEKQISDKLESLTKYLPFIDFILEIDKEKYVKFIDIKRWIVNKKRYPLSDLNKIEQSIITQYKNMVVLDDQKVKPEIMQIFREEFQTQYVDLCSDEEDNSSSVSKENSSNKINTPEILKVNIDSDDDLEIVFVSFVEKEKKQQNDEQRNPIASGEKNKTNGEKKSQKRLNKSEEVAIKECLDELPVELLEEIDDDDHCNREKQEALTEAPTSSSSPNHNGNVEDAKHIFQKPTSSLFKRRYELDQATTEQKPIMTKSSKELLPTISLDSSDDESTEDATANHHQTDRKVSTPLKEKAPEQYSVQKNADGKLVFTRLSSVEQNTSEACKTNSVHGKGNSPPTSSAEDIPEVVTATVVDKVPNNSVSPAESPIENGTSPKKTVSNGEKTGESNEKSTDVLSAISSIDLSSFDNLNMEQLISYIIRIGDQKNSQLESLLLKTILRRVRSSPSAVQQIEPTSSLNDTKFADSPLTSVNTNSSSMNSLTQTGPSVPMVTIPLQGSSVNAAVEMNGLSVGQSLQPPIMYYNNPTLPAQPQQIPVMYPSQTYGYQQPHNEVYFQSTHILPPAQRRLNLNDPRIRNFLNKFKNSPLLTPVEREMAANLGRTPDIPLQAVNTGLSYIPPQPAILTNQAHAMTNITPQSQFRNNIGPRKHNTISYGEYKRRQEQERLQKLQEEEMKRTQEREAGKRRQEMFDDIAKRDSQKTTEEIRSILLNTATAHEEIADTVSKPQDTGVNSSSIKTTSTNVSPMESSLPDRDKTSKDFEDHQNTKENRNDLKKSSTERNKRDKSERLYRELECTVKGFDQIHDYIPKAICGRRRSSIHARSAIAEQLKESEETDSETQVDGGRSRQCQTNGTSRSPTRRKSTDEWPKHQSSLQASPILIEQQSRQSQMDDGIEDRTASWESHLKQKKSDYNVSNTSPTKTTTLFEKDKRNEDIEDQQHPEKSGNNLKKSSTEKSKMDKTQRLYRELECTVKGFDQIHDYIPKAICGRRRSSIHARSAIAEQLKDSEEIDSQTRDDLNRSLQCQTNGTSSRSPRRSRRKTTDEWPKHQSSLQASPILIEQQSKQSRLEESLPKRRKTTDGITKNANVYSDDYDDDVPITPSISSRKKSNRIVDDEDESSDDIPAKTRKLNEGGVVGVLKQPMVKLKRMTTDDIERYTKRPENSISTKPSNILNVELVESMSLTVDEASDALSNSKKQMPKKLNNDCEMTESNTTLCALCNSKPSDLTNHYKRKHKTESYVSRLTWAQLDEISINTPFAKVVKKAKNDVMHYSVMCPFCSDELVEPFDSLYNHYATHTGEYAYQCGGCLLEQPFREDIQSHQFHSKKKHCRSSDLQILCRYPANSMVIYLHYCDICNFVQLNEANVLKHLREHHDQRKSNSNNVRKMILVAISEGPDQQRPLLQLHSGSSDENTQPTTQDICSTNVTNRGHENGDDEIPVRNEACNEEDVSLFYDAAMCPLDQQLRQMHEGEEPHNKSSSQEPSSTQPIAPDNAMVESVMIADGFGMTNIPKILKNEPTAFVDSNYPLVTAPRLTADIHNPIMIKFETPPPENLDRSVTPPRPSLEMLVKTPCLYRTIYRLYPSNVKYLGLYKCMADDCYYSSDAPTEFLKHLENHTCTNLTGDYLQCAYCIIPDGVCCTSQQLVDHIHLQHSHMVFQCSACSYRSCEASNVVVHQKKDHLPDYKTCKVFKCPGVENFELSHTPQYIMVKLSENVKKIQCPYCSSKSFYHSNLLGHHITTYHKVLLPLTLKKYSCIYCSLMDSDVNVLQRHLSEKHPEEFPYICSHNNAVSINEDMLDTLQYFRSTGAVSYTQVNATLDEDAFEDNSQPLTDDIKPSAEELFKCQEETVRIRLRKLTEKTGVAPDCLYHCPEQSCGGFFSVYDSWFRHMRAKHHCLECKCPHCSTPVTLPLEEYKIHLERHRRHTYICFHCSSTFRSDEEASAHTSAIHGSLGSWRTEQIRFNLSYSYFILIQAGLLTSRTELMPVLLNVLDERLKELACNESKALKRSWLVQRHCSAWLEEYPIDGYRTLRKKCFNGNCDFRAAKWEMLFKHVREQHNIKGSAFNCCQCDFNLQNCQHWDDILNHIQQHSDSSFFICGACYSHHNYRSKISAHIREHHAARDVPIVNLIKTKGNHVYLRLAVAFANECPSFSTMRNCFCCDERGMKGDAFTAHLKRYHKFVLNYFCEWCNYPLESLQSAKEHYQTAHTVNKLKLRCELSSKYDISIQSIRDFQVHIDTSKADGGDHQTKLQVVKLECDDNVADSEDDSIVLLDEDDIVMENYIKDQEKIADISDRPKLKCIPMTDLINPPPTTSSAIALSNQNVSSTVRPLPRIKILAARPPHNASTGPNVLISRSNPTALVSSNSVNTVYSSSIGGLAKTVLDVPNTVFTSAQTPQYNTVSFDAAQFGGRG